MKKIILYILFLISLQINSQNNIIYGYIKDTNNIPINDVNVFYKNNVKIGTITDNNGFFKIKQINDTIIFSHILYKTEYFNINYNIDTINIKLISKLNLLNEINISENAKEQNIVNKAWIIDYQINKGLIYIAFASQNGPTIQILNLKNKLLYEENINNFNFFDTDCYNNLYFAIKDTFYLIQFYDYYYEIEKEYSEEYFKKIKFSCDIRIKNKQYFNYFWHPAVNQIYSYNTLTKDLKQIYTIANIKQLNDNLLFDYNTKKQYDKIKKEKINNLKFLDERIDDISYSEAILKDMNLYRKERNLETNEMFFTKIVNKKQESPLFCNNDTLIIINTTNKKAILFYNNKIKERIIKNYPNEKINYFVQDKKNNNIYAISTKKQQTNIYFLDKDYCFYKIKTLKYLIEKPIVYNNILFFLHYFKNNDIKLLQKIWIN